MLIKIERLTSDRLECQLWEFRLNINYSAACKISLSKYVEQERKTTRHKFIEKRNRIYEGNRYNGMTMKKSDVPLPDDVVEDVKNSFKASIDSAEII